jgi:curved DNA-binding protein CbpA
MTFYDTLGVTPAATPSEIRDAYRRLAREEHPDRAPSTASVHLDSMASINEAYRVLSDAGRRAVYDATLRGTGSAVPPSDRTASRTGRSTDGSTSADVTATGYPGHPSHAGPARVPWRMLLFCGVVAVIGVVVLAQFTEPGEPAPPDGILRVGDCVAIEANGDAREVRCIGNADEPAPDDLVVEAFVPFDATCPGLTIAHRDRQGMGVACIPMSE